MRVPLSRRKRINVNREVWVVGAGLAGCEAAWQLALRGIRVRLFEMRPEKMTPAHRTGLFAELVCSNSLRGAALENAVGLLKEELRRLNSVIMSMADRHRVEAGGALAVDRWRFAEGVTQKITEHPLITVVHELTAIPRAAGVIATGPLTSESLADWIRAKQGKHICISTTQRRHRHRESSTRWFYASRYGREKPPI